MLLAVLAVLGPVQALRAGTPSFDAPTGLTLQARGEGRYLLLWDPIHRDDLMGYSVWLRKPGEREFTRLSVPVKVGQEVRKVPLTTEARLTLALGQPPRDIEATVTAEYEDGSSTRAASVFSRRAAAAPASPTAKAEEPGATPVRPGQEPWMKPAEAEGPLIAPTGRWASEWGLSFELHRSIRRGRFNAPVPGLSAGPGEWERVDLRSVLGAPLTLRYGLLPGFEAWARTSYQAEDVASRSFSLNGQELPGLREFGMVNGQWTELRDPTSTGLGDLDLGLRIQPMESLPLLLGAMARLPTGASRFRAYLDWSVGRGYPAGTGEGVQRMEFSARLGRPGRRNGAAFHAAFSPAAVERVNHDLFGTPLDQVLVHGDRFELGGTYTLPWRVAGLPGALVPGITFRSVSPARWTAQGLVAHELFDPVEQARLSAHLMQRFVRDDQLELSLEAGQNLPYGVRTGGRVAYVHGVYGDSLRLSGLFYY